VVPIKVPGEVGEAMIAAGAGTVGAILGRGTLLLELR